jgi:protein phosphatase
MDYFELTHGGSAHGVNEDAVWSWPSDEGLIFAVADGIGAEGGGSVASAFALSVFGREIIEAPPRLSLVNRLRRAVQVANAELYQKALTVPELRRMGTTLTATAVVGTSLVTAHVGDCRLWLLRDKRLIQLTKDHTWVWAHLPGADTLEQTRGHARRYSLPRCLGHELVVSIDMLSMEIHSWDVLVHTSDGVHTALAESDLQDLLEAHPPEAACHALVRRARQEDGQDDVSVQIAAVGQLAAARSRSWWRWGR